ncbi:MAG: hypothetical protein HZA78_08020 [Candidatus Schekmanbacteria bacterium]|nr:hypothetical protein [Candidatus Schekmanbacteria bacterium]
MIGKNHSSETKKCPRNNFKPCIKDECMFWVEIDVQNNLTQERRQLGDCKDNWDVKLRLESERILQGLTASVEGLRNEVSKLPEAKTFSVLAKSFAGLYLLAEGKTTR